MRIVGTPTDPVVPDESRDPATLKYSNAAQTCLTEMDPGNRREGRDFSIAPYTPPYSIRFLSLNVTICSLSSAT